MKLRAITFLHQHLYTQHSMKFFLPLLSLLVLQIPAAVDAQTDVASFIMTALGNCGNAETGAYNSICVQGEIAKNPFDLDSQELGGIVTSCHNDSFEKIATCVEGKLIAITVTDALSMCGNPATGVYNPTCLQGELARQPILIDRDELESLISACAVNRSFGDCALDHFLGNGPAEAGTDDVIDVSADDDDDAATANNGDVDPLPPLEDFESNAANSVSTGLLLVDALVGLSFAGFMLLS